MKDLAYRMAKLICRIISILFAASAAIIFAIWFVINLTSFLAVYLTNHWEYGVFIFLFISYVSGIGSYSLFKILFKEFNDNKWNAFEKPINIFCLILFYFLVLVAFTVMGPQNILIWLK